MRNPFRRQERADVSGGLVRAWQAALAERALGDARATAIAEMVAHEYGAAFAQATSSHPALTPALLGDMGRRLVLHGEYVALIDVVGGAVVLHEAAAWAVTGEGADPASWHYQLTLPRPSTDVSRPALGDEVVHLTYANAARAPWRGLSPLDLARATSQAVGGLEGRLAEELGTPTGYVVPVPAQPIAADDDPLTALAGDLARLKGATTLVESTSAGWGDGKGAAPTAEWTPRRIGAHPPATLHPLRHDLSRGLLAACGVPPDLAFAQSMNGAALLHLRRDFIDAAVEPLLRRCETELRRKLAPGVTLRAARPRGDVLLRSRAAESLVRAGVPVAEARRVAGLEARP